MYGMYLYIYMKWKVIKSKRKDLYKTRNMGIFKERGTENPYLPVTLYLPFSEKCFIGVVHMLVVAFQQHFDVVALIVLKTFNWIYTFKN